jgi:imidazolonepropionase
VYYWWPWPGSRHLPTPFKVLSVYNQEVSLSQSILLRGARQLLTLRGKPGVRRGPDFGNLEIIEDGSVFIQGGKIVSVGPTRRLENLKDVRGAINIPVPNCIVMPGFADPSIQLNLIAPSGKGTQPKRRKLSDFYNESVSLMRSCLQHGTLNAGVKASSGVHSMGADFSVLRQIARLRSTPVGLMRTWCPGTDAEDVPGPQTWVDAVELLSKRKLAESVELRGNPLHPASQRIIQAAEKADLRVSLDWSGGSGDQLNECLSRSSPSSVFCRHSLSTGERDVLADAKSTVVFNAGGALLDGQPESSVRDLIEAGGAIALGSGYDAVYEPNFNMQLVLAVAVRRLNLTIEQAIVATTINAAYAMNCGDEIGSLEPGKRAEVLILNLADYREIPRRLGVNHVAMAIREGNLAINRTRWRVGAA